MTTVISGRSDDTIVLEGDLHDEVHPSDFDGRTQAVLQFSDGTVLEVFYPKRPSLGVWGISVLRTGTLFHHIDESDDDSGKHYSDVAYFVSGITWCIASTEYKTVRAPKS